MTLFDIHHPWAFTFGILGNIISFMVYLAPLPTYIRIYKEKSTMGYDSLPYAVALFSAMLWMYYALLKTNAMLLISINLFGCVIETAYISVFLYYASKKARTHTAKILGVMNVGLLCLIYVLTYFIFSGHTRVLVVGWICVGISVCVFAAPLSIVFRVVRTRSVEFMPLPLSFFLTLSAVMWFSYGLFQNDLCVALPNVLGFFLGMLQMMLYAMYRNKKPLQEIKVVENDSVINIKVVGTPAAENNNIAETKQKGEGEGEGEGEEGQQNTNINTISVEPKQVSMQLESPLQLLVCAA